MQTELAILIFSAVTIACLHTITGPDHYLPFIALSKTRRWSLMRTVSWTILCGCGHVGSSVLLGLGGAAVGWSLSNIKWLEAVRGGIAGWAMLIFGVAYGVYGLIRARQNNPHKHFDMGDNGEMYVYEHKHGEAVNPADRHVVTPWVMFIIFVLGPCEPMIPLLYFPAVKNSWMGMVVLVIVYTFFTLITMLVMVVSGFYGFSFLQQGWSERYIHALGGMTIFICGAGMVFMGW